MQSSKKSAAKRLAPKSLLIAGALVILVVVVTWALYALNRPNPTNDVAKTSPSTESATILSVDASLRQNGATQICSAGNAGPGSLNSSSTNIAYEISKNRSDASALIKKVAADSGYGSLAYTTNGSADFYEGNNTDKSATISFVVYSDRKYADSCQPTPSTDPNQTAFMLSMTHRK